MQPFKIICVTCRAGLTVKNESLVGQIIGCPRCGSMVQVAAPAGFSPSASQDVAREAGGPVGDSLASLGAVTAAPRADFVSIPAAPDSSAAAATTPPRTGRLSDQSEPAATFDFDAAADASAAIAHTPPAPPSAPPSPIAAAVGMSGVKFAALAGLAAVAGAAAVVSAMMWLNADDPPVPSPTVAAAEREFALPTPPNARATAELAPLETTTPAATDPAAADAVGGESFLPLVDVPEDGAGAVEPPLSVPDGTPAPLRTGRLSDQSEPSKADSVVSAPAVGTTVAETPAPADAAAPRLRIDPLDVDPEGLDLATLFGGPPKDPLAESQLPVTSAADVASEAPADPLPGAAAPADAGPQAVRRDDRNGAIGPPDATLLLARRIPALKATGLPLGRLLEFSVELSGVPVSVDPQELRRAGVSAATPTKIEAKDATIEAVLAPALEPLRLKPVVEDGQIVLRRTVEDRRRSVPYKVDDLATTDAAVRQLAAWVEALVAPASWQRARGDGVVQVAGGTLQVDHLESVQYDVLFLLERYRLAAGLPTRSKYPAALLTPSPTAALRVRMNGPATFTFTNYTPLADVFRYWEEELDVAVLVDWPAVAGERLWPQSRIACSAAAQPWGEALDEVLAPLGLAWRPVDARTIEITSRAKVESEPAVEIYLLATIADATQVAMLFEQSFHAIGAVNETATVKAIDGARGILLARLPAAAQRELCRALAEQQLLRDAK